MTADKTNTHSKKGAAGVGPFIIVSGNIGVGKTTFSNNLSKVTGAPVFAEKASTNPWLPLYYRFRKWYALNTQLHFLSDRSASHRHIMNHIDGKGAIQDRSIYDDEVFARLGHDDKDPFLNTLGSAIAAFGFLSFMLFAASFRLHAFVTFVLLLILYAVYLPLWNWFDTVTLISDMEFALYTKVAQEMRSSLSKPDYIIYLAASAETCYARMKKRGIAYESNIEQGYLASIHKHYEAWAPDIAKELLIFRVDYEEFMQEGDIKELMDVIRYHIDKSKQDGTSGPGLANIKRDPVTKTLVLSKVV